MKSGSIPEQTPGRNRGVARRVLHCFVALCCALASGCASSGPDLPMRASAGTDDQNERVREGVFLHEIGDYDGALAQYGAVLEENPDHIAALYEMALTCFVTEDFACSLKTARLGAGYLSPLRAEFLQLAGNALDELGQPDDALGLYRDAIRESPELALPYFNLAVTQTKLGDYAAARRSVGLALDRHPAHTSSHLLLAQLTQLEGERATALLAYLRFLLLEGDGSRARAALSSVNDLAFRKATRVQLDAGQTLVADAIRGTSDPDLALAILSQTDPSPGDASAAARLATIINGLTAARGDADGPLVWPATAERYLTWFRALIDAGHLEAASHFALRSNEDRRVADWLARHRRSVDDYLAWASI